MTTTTDTTDKADKKGKKTEEMLKDAFKSFMEQFKKSQSKSTTTDGTVPGVEFGPSTEVPKKTGINTLLRVTRFCLLMVGGGIIVSNAQPYINLCGMFGNSLSQLGIMPFLLKLPLIGWLLSGGGALSVFIAGLVLWFVLQVLEMLPVLVEDNPQMLLNLIAWASQFRTIKTTENDSESLRRLKSTYNELPTQWLDEAEKARAIGYLIDLVLVMRFYPPIVGGYDRLGVFLSAPQASDIDVQNLCISLFAMFGVEVAYKIWKLFNGFIELASQRPA
jgi:hypothetical protein